MQNVSTKVTGNILTLSIDLSASTHPSKSGKTQVVATTGGNQSVAGPNGKIFKLGLNCYTE